MRNKTNRAAQKLFYTGPAHAKSLDSTAYVRDRGPYAHGYTARLGIARDFPPQHGKTPNYQDHYAHVRARGGGPLAALANAFRRQSAQPPPVAATQHILQSAAEAPPSDMVRGGRPSLSRGRESTHLGSAIQKQCRLTLGSSSRFVCCGCSPPATPAPAADALARGSALLGRCCVYGRQVERRRS